MPPWKTKPLLTAAVSGWVNLCVAAKNAGYADGAVKAGDVGGKPFAGRQGNGVLAAMKIQRGRLKTVVQVLTSLKLRFQTAF
jgi:hypothetical protein